MFGLIDPKMAEKMAENENFKDLPKFLIISHLTIHAEKI